LFKRKCPFCREKEAKIRFSTIFSGDLSCLSCKRELSLILYFIPLTIFIYSFEIQLLLLLIFINFFTIYFNLIISFLLTLISFYLLLIIFTFILPIKEKKESMLHLFFLYAIGISVGIYTIYFFLIKPFLD